MQDFCLTWDPQHLCPVSGTTVTSDTQLGEFFRIICFIQIHTFSVLKNNMLPLFMHTHIKPNLMTFRPRWNTKEDIMLTQLN